MKFKFGFFKTSTHQRFHIEPRYYDPVKEDIANRTARIKRELGMKEEEDMDIGYKSQISGSFRKHMKHTPEQADTQAATLRLVILGMLVLMVGGFVYDITELLFLPLLYVPFYLWKRFRR